MTTMLTNTLDYPSLKTEKELATEYFATLGEEPTLEHAMSVRNRLREEVKHLQASKRNRMRNHRYAGVTSARNNDIDFDDIDRRIAGIVAKPKRKTLSEKYEEHRDVEEWDVAVANSQQEVTVTIDKYDGLPDGVFGSPEGTLLGRAMSRVQAAIEPHLPSSSSREDYFRRDALSRAISTAYEASNTGYGVVIDTFLPADYIEVTVAPSERAIRLKDAQKHGAHSAVTEGWL